jgi:hypothetical protein
MQINILTIYFAFGAALQFARSIRVISACDYYEEINDEEIDDFQIDVLDQEVDVVSCSLLVYTTISLYTTYFNTTCSPLLDSLMIATTTGKKYGGISTGRRHQSSRITQGKKIFRYYKSDSSSRSCTSLRAYCPIWCRWG